MKNSTVLRAAAAVLAVTSAVAITGCSSIAQKATDAAVGNAIGADVNTDNGQLSVTSSDGSMQVDTSGNGIDLPSTWPKEIPVVEGKLTSVMSSGTDVTAAWEITGSAGDAIAAYQKALESAGYKITSNAASDGSTMITAEGAAYQILATASDAANDQPATLGIIATKSQPSDASS